MASYVEKTLAVGEHVIVRGKPSWWPWVPAIVLACCGVLTIPLLLIPILVMWSKELALTNKRVVVKGGLISRKTVELRISRIECVGVRQGVLGRLFNVGTIFIHGTGGTATEIRTISNPMKFRKAVDRLLIEQKI